MRNIVDSCGWLEFFADGPNAAFFAEPLNDAAGLVVPTITIYEVFKVVLRERGEDAALEAVALMQQGTIADLSSSISLQAAKISFEENIPMADSIIVATARQSKALVWTQDEHFRNVSEARYRQAK